MTDTGTRFVYVSTRTDCLEDPALEVDLEEVARLRRMTGKRHQLYSWLQCWLGEEAPPIEEIVALEVEIEDDPDKSLAVGNDTVNLWPSVEGVT